MIDDDTLLIESDGITPRRLVDVLGAPSVNAAAHLQLHVELATLLQNVKWAMAIDMCVNHMFDECGHTSAADSQRLWDIYMYACFEVLSHPTLAQSLGPSKHGTRPSVVFASVQHP